MANSEWEPFKTSIAQLYLDEDKTLQDVRKTMKNTHNFCKSKGQYQRQLKKWGFEKNEPLPYPDAWESYIGPKIEKRKRLENKESAVYFDNEEYPPDKVRKALSGKGYVATHKRFRDDYSPNPPHGIIVRTPVFTRHSPELMVQSPPRYLRVDCGLSLPWQGFTQMLQAGIDAGQSSLSLSAIAPPNWGVKEWRYNLNREVIRRLRAVLPWERLSHAKTMENSASVAAALRIVMPDNNDQCLELATRFCSSGNSVADRFMLELFFLSNYLIPEIESFYTESQSEPNVIAHDERTIRIFRISALNNSQRFASLLRIGSPTTQAIAEQLFASALRTLELDIVTMMLTSGMNSQNVIEVPFQGCMTPLQYAAFTSCPKGAALTRTLISHGADVEWTPNGYETMSYPAYNKPNMETIDLLLSNGGIVREFALTHAVGEANDLDLFLKLLDACTDVNAQIPGDQETPLEVAVRLQKIGILKLLLARGADVRNPVVLTNRPDLFSQKTCILGLAAMLGDLETFEVVLQAYTKINPLLYGMYDRNGQPLTSPLALAIYGRNFEITKLLLEAGFEIDEFSPYCSRNMIELAAENSDVDLCALLIKHGASVDRPFSHDADLSALRIAVQHHDFDIIDLLMRSHARLNDTYTTAPDTVFSAAIEVGCPQLIRMLHDAGATGFGRNIRRIGSLKGAEYLEELGILQEMLEGSGASILSAALVSKDDGFVEWLLQRDVAVDPNPMALMTPLGAAIGMCNHRALTAILERNPKVTDFDIAQAICYVSRHYKTTTLLTDLLVNFCGNAPTAVGTAIMERRPDLVRSILDANIDPMGTPVQGSWEYEGLHIDSPYSVLEIAARFGERSILQILLSTRIWAPALMGRALVVAILLHKDDLADDLLKSSAGLNEEIGITKHRLTHLYARATYYEWKEGITPLQAAIGNQRMSIARKLIARPDSDIDIDFLGEGDGRRTALQLAVEIGNAELVDLLLERGANVNSPPGAWAGRTALQLAASKGYLGIARKLIGQKANVNAPPAQREGITALEGAAQGGRIDMIQLLLDNGASVTSRYNYTSQYENAVDIAEDYGHYGAANLLKQYKREKDAASPINWEDWLCSENE
ncbi:ankyrin [Aspergillus californicus]